MEMDRNKNGRPIGVSDAHCACLRLRREGIPAHTAVRDRIKRGHGHIVGQRVMTNNYCSDGQISTCSRANFRETYVMLGQEYRFI